MIRRLKKFTIFAVTFFMLGSSFTNVTYAAENNKNVIETNENKVQEENKDNKDNKISAESKDNKDSSTEKNLDKQNSDNNLKNKDNKDEDESSENEDKLLDEEKPEEIIMEDGWNIINGKKFYVIDNKVIDNTGWFKESYIDKSKNSEDEYYLNDDHSVVTGWKNIGNEWFYFDSEGIMRNGWIDDNGSVYYLDRSGEMLKGWNTIEGAKYYFEGSGKRITGKYYIDDNWYFFNSLGQLETGIYENKGKLYYSNDDGVMSFDSWVDRRNKEYYAKSDGSLAVGNLYLDGKIYNFNDDGSFNATVDDDESLLYIEFLSVGDADCEFIKLPSGETVLIDTGDVSTADKVVDFLKKQKLKTELFKISNDEVIDSDEDKNSDKDEKHIDEDSDKDNKAVDEDSDKEDNNADEDKKINDSKKAKNDGRGVIDYVILTHPHSDHIGGMIDILKNFNVGQVLIPKNFELIDFSDLLDDSPNNKADKDIMKIDYKIYNDTMEAIRNNNVKVKEIVPESYLDSQKILQFKNTNRDFVKECTLAPYNKYASYNNNSAIVYLDYKDLQALFTADIEWNAEIDFVNRKALNGKEVDVLKAPHHGNDTSSSYIFMSYVKPDVAIVSRSKDSINKSIAQVINTTYPVCGVNKYETSTDDGVSLYSTQDNWTIVKKSESESEEK